MSKSINPDGGNGTIQSGNTEHLINFFTGKVILPEDLDFLPFGTLVQCRTKNGELKTYTLDDNYIYQASNKPNVKA